MNLPHRLRRFGRYLWREWIRPLAIPLALVAAAKSALADINIVPSGSMKPTILEGDVVFINKVAYDVRVPFTFTRLGRWSDPARGDIVVCYEPNDGTRLVKRVIGLPGDTIELRNEAVYLNGVRQTYRPVDARAGQALEPAEREASVFASEELGGRRHTVMAMPALSAPRTFGPITVPRGSYFVMGDNRDVSRDSRYFGFMPRERITGRVKSVFVSADIHHWLRPRFDRFCSELE